MTAFRLSVLVLGALALAQFNEWQPLDRILVAGVALLVAAFLWSKSSLRGVTVTRRVATDRAQVGQTLTDEIKLSNRGLIGKLWLEVRDHSSLPGHSSSRVVHVGGRKSNIWSASTVCARRGQYQLGPMTLKSGDPFGIFPAKVHLAGTIEILVYPAVVDLPSFPLPSSTLSGGPAPDRRTQMVTPMVTGIRDYVAGDAFNRMSWTATARLGRLMVKEFDVDPTSDVWLILDLDEEHLMRVRRDAAPQDVAGTGRAVEAWLDSTEEYAVAVTASLARCCLNQGRGVGMIATGAHYEVIQAERSDRTYIKMLETLAVVAADGHRRLAEVLVAEARRFNRNSSLIVVTASEDLAWVDALATLTSRRVQASAVVIDRSSFGGNARSSTFTEHLAKSRLSVYRIGYGDLIGEALRAKAF
jgi:uncharacterized protein (DUF58 family)